MRGNGVSEITEELLRRLERAARSPVEVTADTSPVEAIYEATLAAEVEQFAALRDAIIRLDARLDAAGIAVPPDHD